MPKSFICPTCGKKIATDLQMIVEHTDQHVVRAISKHHPEWVEHDGICRKCYAYYKKQMGKE